MDVWQIQTCQFYTFLGGVHIRAVTVADFYHRGGNGPTTAGGAVLCIFISIILKRKNK